MISEERVLLNERFIKVFELLEERGEVIKNDRNGRGMGDFASKILGKRAYGHIIRAFLNPKDKRVIDYDRAKKVCRIYGVNEDYLLKGIGTPFGFDIPRPAISDAGSINAGNILFTSVEAFAGTAIDTGAASEDLEYFSIPGFSGNGLVAFPIHGNSMEPVIMDNDVVICKQVNSFRDVIDNEIYAVKNNGSIWIKYLQRLVDHKGRVNRFKLISANYLEHDPFEEEVNEHTRLYKVISRINKL